MGKRSDMGQNEAQKDRNYYPTPAEAVRRAAWFFAGVRCYWEPCCGDGRLITHLDKYTTAQHLMATDIEPQGEYAGDYHTCDATDHDVIYNATKIGCETIITNPPWDADKLLPMLDAWLNGGIENIYLLLSADWAHTQYATKYMYHCHDIVPVGRIKWIEGSKHTSKDNVAWYLFKPDVAPTTFHPRGFVK